MHGFGFTEMPPIIYGGKDEIKCNPLISDGVNNLGIHEIKDSERSVPFTARRAFETLLVLLCKKG